MKYSHIARYVAETLWAIHPVKLAELLSVLAFRAAGHEFTAEEIAARIGGDGGGRAPASATRGAVAVIPIRGVIAHRMGAMDNSSGGTSCEQIAGMLRQCVADDSISSIVFDVDSPGGSVTGMSELAAEVFAARASKQLTAVANGLMCSAAYDIASQAHEIVGIPSSSIGSIGVFTAHQDLSKALEQQGVKVTLISAGKHKVEGNPFEPLSDDAKAVLQARVDAAYGQFVTDVARGRGVSAAAVRSGYGEGRALGATDAKKAGLIDRIATMDDTLARLTGRKSISGMRAELLEAHPSASAEEIDALLAAQVVAERNPDEVKSGARARRRELF
jgi:signal peptide peptidase SppA